jgi:hypothetical protein
LIEHPLRTFTVTRDPNVFAEPKVEIQGHTVVIESGVLSVVVIKRGMPYLGKGFAPGTWLDYSATIPSDREVGDAQAEADRVSRARREFEVLDAGQGPHSSKRLD